VDITEDQDAYAMVKELGFTSAPVVITQTDKWSGFRIEKLNALVA
jgi:glutaredoxin-like protein NrdH